MTAETLIDKPQGEKVIYDKIGRSYDETRSADSDIVATLSKLLSPELDGSYLDIGCGSGNYTTALSQLGRQMTGVDISEEMLRKARNKSNTVSWIKGDAKQLQFSAGEFDGATCVLASHHIQEHAKAFHEAYRILKPGTRFVIFTTTPEQMRGYWLYHYFPKMMDDGCEIMSSQNKLSVALTNAGFSNISAQKFFVTNALQDWFLQAGKYRPEIYLDPIVRAGISLFAISPHDAEVAAGLRALKNDIDNKTIQTIIDKYENQNGDALFLCATR